MQTKLKRENIDFIKDVSNKQMNTNSLNFFYSFKEMISKMKLFSKDDTNIKFFIDENFKTMKDFPVDLRKNNYLQKKKKERKIGKLSYINTFFKAIKL